MRSAAAVGVGLSIGLGLLLWALAPCLPVLLRERAFAEDVKVFAEKTLTQEPVLRRGTDAALRGRLQALARARGLSLAFEDVFVSYGSLAQGDASGASALEGPLEIGYTLPMRLPLFGIHESTFYAARVFEVPPSPGG
ncbi:MAG: hypothetical protein IOD12_12980 [Silvanigrellales bacterium]|nr:hypothetical protein [Silvanigrellales bacterium]